MRIIGNGVDIVENQRIKKAIIQKTFIKRIYSISEIRESKKIRNKRAIPICLYLLKYTV